MSLEDRVVARHGQPISILGLFATLLLGAFLLLMFRPIWDAILQQGSDRASNPKITQANEWLGMLTGNLELFFVIISIFGLLVLAVFRSKVGAS